MKKYVKPELFYERFELSQHIADCAWELQFEKGACEATPDKEQMPTTVQVLFTDAITDCTLKDSIYQDYCYQPGTGVPVFRS